MATITAYTLHTATIPLQPPIGDSQVLFKEHGLIVLELHTDEGHTGVGFDIVHGPPLPPRASLSAQFEAVTWPDLKGGNPVGLAHRITRPRGGTVGAAVLPRAVETALWDLVGKQIHQPLYRVFGGTNPRVEAYGSPLGFRLTEADLRKRLERFADQGFTAVKMKVGHPDVGFDLGRLRLAQDVLGADATLMVDANEAWSPKEALIALRTYRDAGFDLYWVEDPIARDDYQGLRMLREQASWTRINTGEYVGFTGKRRLLEAQAVDVLNCHDSVRVTRHTAYLAGDYGIPVALGNTICEVGVHLAASLPECVYMEYADLAWNQVIVQPVIVQDGRVIAPDRPGHGLELDRDKLASFAAA